MVFDTLPLLSDNGRSRYARYRANVLKECCLEGIDEEELIDSEEVFLPREVSSRVLRGRNRRGRANR